MSGETSTHVREKDVVENETEPTAHATRSLSPLASVTSPPSSPLPCLTSSPDPESLPKHTSLPFETKTLPRTPGKRAPPNNNSTPCSQPGTATAARAGAYKTMDNEDIKPWVYYDVENAETVEDFTLFVKVFLEMAHEPKKGEPSPEQNTEGAVRSSSDTLLDKCLQYVRTMINDDQKGKDEFATYVEAYCSAEKPENRRYEPLIRLCNHSLERLWNAEKHINVEPRFRQTDDLEIMFVHSDPLNVNQEYSYRGSTVKSSKKPDIGVISRKVAQHHFSNNVSDWKSLATKARERPVLDKNIDDNLDWSKLLAAVDCKVKIFRFPYKRVDVARKDHPGIHPPKPMPKRKTQSCPIPVPKPVAQSLPLRQSPRLKRPGPALTAQSDGRALKKMRVEPEKANPYSTKGTPQEADMPDDVQVGMYAAHMLSRSTPTSHAIGFLLRDELLYLWWYDRQGAIKSSAIDIVKDFDYFLVLLLALQRFDLEDWGLLTEFNHTTRALHLKETTPPTSTCVQYDNYLVTLEKPSLPKTFSLKGRGTTVVNVQKPVLRTDALNPEHKLEPDWYTPDDKKAMEFVMKLSWVNASRIPEADLVQKVRSSIEENDPDKKDAERVGKHLPWIVDWKDHGHSTAVIRRKLNIPVSTRSVNGEDVPVARVLRSLVSEKLEPAADLDEVSFFTVWLGMIGCVYGCWARGVYYRDPSMNNSMYRRVGGKLYGVPNDFDLATTPDASHNGLERTGTIPYMALELLEDPSGKVVHHLRHDLESFYWVLCWSCFCHPDPATPLLREWQECDYPTCAEKKSAWQYKPRNGYREERLVLGKVWECLRKEYGRERLNRSEEEEDEDEDADEDEKKGDDDTDQPTPESIDADWVLFANWVVKSALRPSRKKQRQPGQGPSIPKVATAFALVWKDKGVSKPEGRVSK